jgi:hypothetical protein
MRWRSRSRCTSGPVSANIRSRPDGPTNPRRGGNRMPLNDTVARVTDRIVARSRGARGTYLDRMARLAEDGPRRAHLSCGNLAHAYAASGTTRTRWPADRAPNLGIVTAYNDMLSAHQPFETYPQKIKAAARAGRRHRAGRGRGARDVRRRHPGPAGHGAVAVLARRDRARGRGGDEPQRLRRGGLPRRLRQDRAGPRDRGGDLRLRAGGLHPGGADDERAAERREGQGPPEVRGRRDRAATS